MKKLLVAVLVAAIGMAGSWAYAQTAAPATPPGKQVDVNALRQFQKETLPLRDEMQAKRLELRNEFSKETPDRNKIAQLQKDMIDLRTKVQAAAEKNGVQGWGYGPRGAGWRGAGPKATGANWNCPRGAGTGYGRGPGAAGGPGAGYGPGCGRCF